MNKHHVDSWNDAIEAAALIMDRWLQEASIGELSVASQVQATVCKNAARAIRKLKK